MASRFGGGLSGTFLETVKRSSRQESIADELRTFEQLAREPDRAVPAELPSAPGAAPPSQGPAPTSAADPTLAIIGALLADPAGLSVTDLVRRTRLDITTLMVTINHGMQFGLFRRVGEDPPRIVVTPEGRQAHLMAHPA